MEVTAGYNIFESKQILICLSGHIYLIFVNGGQTNSDYNRLINSSCDNVD